MKLGELKSQIQTLGFEDTTTMSDAEYSNIIINGINRAMQMIAQEVAPILSEIDFTVDDTATIVGGRVEFDLSNIPEYEEDYLGTEKVRFKNESYASFNEAFAEEGSKLYLEYKKGTYTIVYRHRPNKITLDSPDTEVIDMPAALTNLIAPLAAYYIWFDDDMQKAQMYRNDYEQLKETYSTSRSNVTFDRTYSM